jgi:hypothetical protein
MTITIHHDDDNGILPTLPFKSIDPPSQAAACDYRRLPVLVH